MNKVEYINNEPEKDADYDNMSLVEYLDRAVEFIGEIGRAETRESQAECVAAAIACIWCARWLIDGAMPEDTSAPFDKNSPFDKSSG
jgi:hypothetical protein